MKQIFLLLFLVPFFTLYAGNRNLSNQGSVQISKNNTPAKISTHATVMLSNNSKYGSILTDGAGYTLYFFTKDTLNSSCNGQCAVIWPVFYADTLTVGAGLADSNFTKIIRSDGSPQYAYKGWPLYYYSGDSNPGDVNGEDFGGIWFVAKPNYTIMLMNNQLVGLDSVAYNSTYKPGLGAIQYFVDGYGRTLYIFTHDTYNQNHFTKSDFSNNGLWAIYEDSLQALPPSIDSNYFSMINVYGRKQLTYKGWPLYEFGPDSMQRGNTRGVSFPSPGIWPVAVATLDSATITTGIALDNSSGLPNEYSLSQNYPNPFNPSTEIKFSITKPGLVSLRIYNVLGQEVDNLVNRFLSSGSYRVSWNADNMPSGIYLYSLSSGSFMQVKKMILLK